MKHWLSFASDEGFLGAAIIEAEDFISAVLVTHSLGINPGGEVQGMAFDGPVADAVPADWCARLLTRAECEEFDAMMDLRLLN